VAGAAKRHKSVAAASTRMRGRMLTVVRYGPAPKKFWRGSKGALGIASGA
jgi:hypothetical protein